MERFLAVHRNIEVLCSTANNTLHVVMATTHPNHLKAKTLKQPHQVSAV